MPLSNLIFLLLLSRKCKWITPTFLLTAVLSMQTFGDKLKIANPETHKGWLFDSIFLQTCRAPEQPVASSTAPMPRHCPVVSFCLLHPCQGGESLLSQTPLTTAENEPSCLSSHQSQILLHFCALLTGSSLSSPSPGLCSVLLKWLLFCSFSWTIQLLLFFDSFL